MIVRCRAMLFHANMAICDTTKIAAAHSRLLRRRNGFPIRGREAEFFGSVALPERNDFSSALRDGVTYSA
jgi:hypothetical protein